MVFPVGQRPSAEGIESLLASAEAALRAVQVSHKPNAAEGWVELLASGLTFELSGLPPAPPSSVPEPAQTFGLAADLLARPLEAVTLHPGGHIAGGRAMLPVVRTMTGLAAGLALHLPATAVCWHPAGTWMDPEYFARVVLGWQAGGAFPALGLTAIEETGEGGVLSSGLAFFIGQEVRVEPRSGEATADTVKLAVRMIDHLVHEGPLKTPREIAGPGGETLLAEPSEYGKLVVV